MHITNEITGSVDLASGVITISDVETKTPGFDDPFDPNKALVQHYRQVLDTRESMVRDALIKLGWTPPPNSMLHSKREG